MDGWLGFAWLAGLGRRHLNPRFGVGLVSVLTLGEREGGRQKEDLLHSTKHRSRHAGVERRLHGAGEETGFGDGFRARAGSWV